MKLGGSSKKWSMLDSLIKEDHLVPVPVAKKPGAAADAVVPAAAVAASVHPVTLTIEERLSCQVRDLRSASDPTPSVWRCLLARLVPYFPSSLRLRCFVV